MKQTSHDEHNEIFCSKRDIIAEANRRIGDLNKRIKVLEKKDKEDDKIINQMIENTINEIEQGYAKALDDVEKIIDDECKRCLGVEYSKKCPKECQILHIKQSLAKLKEKTK